MERRYELRHFASPELALQIRGFVREYLELDEHGVDKPDCSYPVHTIYLDSDDWKIYWRTIQRDQDRWKLCLRYYDNHPESPIFCEVKHQMTDVVVKYRGGLRREALDSVLAGSLPHSQQLTSKGPMQFMAVERFVGLMLEFQAKPRLHIFCLREAYVSYHGKWRVTLDRHIVVSDLADDLLAIPTDNPLICVDHAVILDLRFAERFPDWYRELVRTFDLSQSFSWKRSQRTIACAGLHLTPDDVIYNIVL